ncbi:MAG: SufD family Fe-S cluster assembly protein [Bacteroidia bacterium]|nr:SufD family Fe-S cluster assembly protein [Bacteroidia bacterium]
MAASAITSIPRPFEVAEWLSEKSGKCTFLNDDDFRSLMEFLHASHFPNTKNEEYRFFPIETYLRKSLKPDLTSEQTDVDLSRLPQHPDAINIYLLNGNPIGNLPEGLSGISFHSFNSLADQSFLKSVPFIVHSPDVFQVIALLYPSHGLGIHIGGNIEKKICIWNVFTLPQHGISVTNIKTVLEENSNAEILEYFINFSDLPSPVFQIHFHEKEIKNGARLKNYLVQNLNSQTYLHSSSWHHLYAGAFSEQTVFSLQGGMIRNNHAMLLHESHANGKMYGLSIGKNKDIIDHHTLIRHFKENAESYEFYKGIADDSSTLVFNGKIYVDYHAQKTNSYQNSKFLIMGNQAAVHAKPQLEIFANDVKCSHGSATGRPDEMALFYMQSRGISRKKALELWAQGFFSEIMEKTEDTFTLNYVENRLHA